VKLSLLIFGNDGIRITSMLLRQDIVKRKKKDERMMTIDIKGEC
jgi:hypothetical protein